LLKRKSQKLTLRLVPRIKSLRDLNKSFEQFYRTLDFKEIRLQTQVVHHLKIKVIKIIRPIVALETTPEDAIFLLHEVIVIIIIIQILETVPTATDTETGIGILPTEVTIIIAKITLILASPLTKEGLKILIPRIIRILLILKVLTNQHSRIRVKMVPKTSDSLETLVAIDQVVIFAVHLVVIRGSMNKIGTAFLLKQEETKILPNPMDRMLNVLVTSPKLVVQVVSTFLVKTHRLVLTNGVMIAICVLVRIVGAKNARDQLPANLKCSSATLLMHPKLSPPINHLCLILRTIPQTRIGRR